MNRKRMQIAPESVISIHQKKIDYDNTTRWANYRIANERFPHVRSNEIDLQYAITNPQPGETIVEIGTGTGQLALALAQAVTPGGNVITCDCIESNLLYLKSKKIPLPTTLQTQQMFDPLPIKTETVDTATSIATLHHFDDRSIPSGLIGRTHLIHDLHRIMRPGGLLVISDVADQTPPQQYFDHIINNKQSRGYCHPNGHPHDFLDEQTATTLCREAGFEQIQFQIKKVPWQFTDESEAGDFLNTIHNAHCQPEESLQYALKYLPHEVSNNTFILHWSLFYLTAKKPKLKHNHNHQIKQSPQLSLPHHQHSDQE